MENNFWKKLPKPFFCLSPMLDITDSPFRQIVAKCQKPDVFYAWFVSVDGLCSRGKENIMKNPNLNISKKEKPIVAQLFGKDPEKFEKSAKIMAKFGFDGIDINMGCPDKDILKQGAGAALIKDPKLAREIIEATKKGAGNLPVSVKTRIGFYKKNEMDNWINEIISEKPASICLHGRTAVQKYAGEADWEVISKAVQFSKNRETLIIGNGDVKNRKEGILKAQESGVNGIMIGRGILANPWVFSKKEKIISQKEKMEMLEKHANLFEKYYREKKGFGNFRKYIRCYVWGFPEAKELRMKLMGAKNAEEIRRMIS